MFCWDPGLGQVRANSHKQPTDPWVQWFMFLCVAQTFMCQEASCDLWYILWLWTLRNVSILFTDTFCKGYVKNKLLPPRQYQLQQTFRPIFGGSNWAVLRWLKSLSAFRAECHKIKTFLGPIVTVSEHAGQTVTVSKWGWTYDQGTVRHMYVVPVCLHIFHHPPVLRFVDHWQAHPEHLSTKIKFDLRKLHFLNI